MPDAKFLPTEVNPSGLTALIKNLGRDCHPTQFLREFTKNAIEACQRTNDGHSKIIVDFNHDIFNGLHLHKICFIDTGDGMTNAQMLTLLNNLSATGSTNQFQNYGVGAKISALTRNHCGIQYESWKDGAGHMIFIKYNAEQCIYGIEGVVSQDGSSHYAVELSPDAKPKEIVEHGTRVTLWGMEDGQDTMMPPDGTSGIKESWIALYLNTRFFRIPAGIEMGVRIGYYRENNPRHNYILTIRGQKDILDNNAQLKGTFKSSDASIHWWVMPKNADGHGREFLKGHTALICEDEIFDISDSRSNRAAFFGVIYGRDRIIIYVEPSNVVHSTSRTTLLRPDGSIISWDNWTDEFRKNMPEPLRMFLDELQREHVEESHTDSIKERLKELKELYRLSRFKADPTGTEYADLDSKTDSKTGHIRRGDPKPNPQPAKPSPGSRSGPLSTILLTTLVDKNIGTRVSTTEPDPFPRVTWVNASDTDNEQLIDRAAEYLQAANVILANSNFQGLDDLTKYIAKKYDDLPEYTAVIKDEVKQAFEQALTECVAGALSLKNRPKWNIKDFEVAISREALTTAVMQRYWMVSHIRKMLSRRLTAKVENSDGQSS